MAFERFTKTGRGYAPKASIWSRGQIGFNRGAVERYNLKNYDYAVFFYDKENKEIGVKFTNNPAEEGANKIMKSQSGIFMSAKAFLDYYAIPYNKERKKYDVKYDQENDLYVFKHD